MVDYDRDSILGMSHNTHARLAALPHESRAPAPRTRLVSEEASLLLIAFMLQGRGKEGYMDGDLAGAITATLTRP